MVGVFFFSATFDWKIYKGGPDWSAGALVRGGGCNRWLPGLLPYAGVSERAGLRGGGSEIRTLGHGM